VTQGITLFTPLCNEEALLECNTLAVLRYLPQFGMPFGLILGSQKRSLMRTERERRAGIGRGR
jgi:hypothetical protein